MCEVPQPYHLEKDGNPRDAYEALWLLVDQARRAQDEPAGYASHRMREALAVAEGVLREEWERRYEQATGRAVDV